MSQSFGAQYRTMVDFAQDALRERIVTGELAPGQRIDQDAEASRLNASRMPIREALRRLEAEGLVEIVPHRGAVVRPLSVDDLEDLYIARIALETVAGRLAASRIGSEALAEMRELLEPLTSAMTQRDVDEWLALDWRFHRTLYEEANSPRLLRMIEALRAEASRFRKFGLSLPEIFEASMQSRRDLYEACWQQDGERVESILRADMERIRCHIRSALLGGKDVDGIGHGRGAIVSLASRG